MRMSNPKWLSYERRLPTPNKLIELNRSESSQSKVFQSKSSRIKVKGKKCKGFLSLLDLNKY